MLKRLVRFFRRLRLPKPPSIPLLITGKTSGTIITAEIDGKEVYRVKSKMGWYGVLITKNIGKTVILKVDGEIAGECLVISSWTHPVIRLDLGIKLACSWPKFTLSVQSLIFYATAGSIWDPPSQRFWITRTPGGGRGLIWAIQTSEKWLAIPPDHGEGTRLVLVKCHSRGKPVGVYAAEISVGAMGNEPQTIKVRLEVK